MDAQMAGRWMQWPGADLAWQVLDQGLVVHHALSNDTHVLAAWLAPVLAGVCAPGGSTLVDLAQRCGCDPSDLAAALDQLQRLRLITPC